MCADLTTTCACTGLAGKLVRARKLFESFLSSEPPKGWTEDISYEDAPKRIRKRHDDCAIGPEGEEAVEDVQNLYSAHGEALPPNLDFVYALEKWQAVDAKDCAGIWYKARCLLLLVILLYC